MPINENDYRKFDNSQNSPPTNMMSKAELRKTHKPIMEKRRRAKINNCLDEIKALVLKALKKDPERHSKLEKADILEMAVKHLKNVQKQQREIAIHTDPIVAQRYCSGYHECMQEVNEYVDAMEEVDSATRQRIKIHLSKCMSGIEYGTQNALSVLGNSSSNLLASFAKNHQNVNVQNTLNGSLNSSSGSSEDDVNNNPKFNGIELIPSCLPNGDFAFVVPKTSINTILTPHSDCGEDNRPSAFVTVLQSTSKSRPILSPPLSPSSSSDDLIQVYRQPLTPPAQIPRSFKPVVSKPFPTKQMVSSTVTSNEIQQLKYPINHQNYAISPLKIKDEQIPLCVITNQNERHKFAQVLNDSKHYEENSYHQSIESRGIKRLRESTGLLTLAVGNNQELANKMLKVSIDGIPNPIIGKTFSPKIIKAKTFNRSEVDVKPSTSKAQTLESISEAEEASSSCDDKNLGGDCMWRPW